MHYEIHPILVAKSSYCAGSAGRSCLAHDRHTVGASSGACSPMGNMDSAHLYRTDADGGRYRSLQLEQLGTQDLAVWFFGLFSCRCARNLVPQSEGPSRQLSPSVNRLDC